MQPGLFTCYLGVCAASSLWNTALRICYPDQYKAKVTLNITGQPIVITDTLGVGALNLLLSPIIEPCIWYCYIKESFGS